METNDEKKVDPTSAAKAAEKMVSVKLLLPHTHDGKEYKAGETVSLPAADAEFVQKAQGIK